MGSQKYASELHLIVSRHIGIAGHAIGFIINYLCEMCVIQHRVLTFTVLLFVYQL